METPEQKAAAAKAADEKAAAEKAAAEKAAAEKAAADKKAAAAKKAAADKKAAAEKAPKPVFKVTAKVDGFRRCGVRHSTAGTEHFAGDFTKDQVKQLEAEPMLVVQHL